MVGLNAGGSLANTVGSALNNVALSEGYVAMHRCEDGHYRLVRPLALTPKAISEAGLR